MHTTLSTPPKMDDIKGAWIAFDSNAATFYRIVLNGNTGLLAYGFPGYPNRLYKINGWALNNDKFYSSCVTNVTKIDETLHISGLVAFNKLDLTIMSPDGSWERSLNFFREDLIESRINDLRESMHD